MRKKKRKALPNAYKEREAEFKEIFKNSPVLLRRSYWFFTFFLDLIGLFLIYLVLANFYVYFSPYLSGSFLRIFSLLIFFLILFIFGFFFHSQISLRVLSIFYNWYKKKKKGKNE